LQTCNIEVPEQLEQFVAYALAKLGQFDFVIHSIAWAPLQELHGRVVDSTSEGFARAMDVSCHSFAALAKQCAPHMPQGGSMVTMTYLGADEAVPHYGLMGPVKAALESLVRYMALELGPQNIRVHAVSPGPIPTRAASGIEAFDDLMQHNIQKAPLGRLVSLQEIANLSTFLCTDAASGMTGQTIYVDAGSHAVD
jgi:enoyl-[acyl-carrier protein] reductase I